MKGLLCCTVHRRLEDGKYTGCYPIDVYDVIDRCDVTYLIDKDDIVFDGDVVFDVDNDYKVDAWVKVNILAKDERGSIVVLPTLSTFAMEDHPYQLHLGRVVLTVQSFEITFPFDVDR